MVDGSDELAGQVKAHLAEHGVADIRASLVAARPGKGLRPDDDFDAAAMRSAGIAAEQLAVIVERIERLEEAKADIARDIAAIYAEAKAQGYDAPTIRRTVKARRIDPKDRAEAQAMLDLYLDAVGEAGASASEGGATARSASKGSAGGRGDA
ncbi:MAG: DUF2312 domain-containing protein [Pikeienuella sp.]|uniref:DUF2312 domain-containing protein n=1 Tax=Pikeienuella sp. TaxID=2831957 RepID=UPI0039187317